MPNVKHLPGLDSVSSSPSQGYWASVAVSQMASDTFAVTVNGADGAAL